MVEQGLGDWRSTMVEQISLAVNTAMAEMSQRLEACIARFCEQEEVLMKTLKDDQLRYQKEVRSSLSPIMSHDTTTEFSAQRVFDVFPDRNFVSSDGFLHYSGDNEFGYDGFLSDEIKFVNVVEKPVFAYLDNENSGVEESVVSKPFVTNPNEENCASLHSVIHGVVASSQGSKNDVLVDVYGKNNGVGDAIKKIENDTCVNGEGYETVLILDPGGDGHQKGTNVSNDVAASVGVFSDSQISTKKVGLTAKWGSTFWKDCHHMRPGFESGTESKFESEVGRLPVAGSEEDVDKLVFIAGKINETLRHDKLDDINSKPLRHSAFGARAVLNPMAAMFGGIIGQEVRKACSGKFHPLFQFFYFDSIESPPTEQLDLNDFRPLNNRYDAQISVFGAKLQKKLEDAQLFVVGSGALGCEFLKNLALIGVSCSSRGKLIVTEDGVIEKSNLNRQFLFRDWNIGQAKSSVAATGDALINPSRNIKALQNRIGPETENVFDDIFWKNLNVVVNALDNVNARLYEVLLKDKGVLSRLKLLYQLAGINVKVITGDSVFTAKAIATECGILQLNREMDSRGMYSEAVVEAWIVEICKFDGSRKDCECPETYSLFDPNDTQGGCKPNFTQNCDDSSEDLFKILEMPGTDWQQSDYERMTPISEPDECKRLCSIDCFCVTAHYEEDSCWKKELPLGIRRNDSSVRGKTFLKFSKGPPENHRGPGCSSICYGMAEIGPFHVNKDGKTLFSIQFLLNWFERFPYAGHYVPQLSQAIVKHNLEKKAKSINLKGYMVGNALTDDFHDHLGLFQFMWSTGLISDRSYKKLNLFCDSQSFVHTSEQCDMVLDIAQKEFGNIDPYSIFTLCTGNVSESNEKLRRRHKFGNIGQKYDPCTEKHSTVYFNLPEVQKALHVHQRAAPFKWETCSDEVNLHWKDSPKSMLDVYHELIRFGLRIWVFNGDTDAVIPVTSTRYTIDALQLPTVTPWHAWYDEEGQIGGLNQVYEGLRFGAVKVEVSQSLISSAVKAGGGSPSTLRTRSFFGSGVLLWTGPSQHNRPNERPKTK